MAEEAQHTSHVVLEPLELPHWPREHQAIGPCPDCDEKTGLVPAGPGLFKYCPTCNGTRQGGPDLGMVPDQHPPGRYAPGQTVHLNEEQAKDLIDAGLVAPQGAENVDELMVRAAAGRLGLTVSAGA